MESQMLMLVAIFTMAFFARILFTTIAQIVVRIVDMIRFTLMAIAFIGLILMLTDNETASQILDGLFILFDKLAGGG